MVRRRMLLGRRMLLAGLVLALAAVVLYRATRPNESEGFVTPVVAEMRALRVSVDSCEDAVGARRADLLSYTERVDSLRERVHAFEALDPRGVPADSYSTYLEAFEEYNESVPAWTDRADEIESEWEECHALADTHNALRDSLQRIMKELGRDSAG